MDRRHFLKVLGCASAAAAPAALASVPKKEVPAGAVGMLYDSTKCIGCKTCVVACREANGMTPQRSKADGGLHDMQTRLDYDTKTVIKVNTQSGRFFKAQCMHCVDPACVSACMLGSLQKREFGVVTYRKELCVGCRYCQIACPFGVPTFDFASATPTIVKCEMCIHRLVKGLEPACTAVCPRKAVIFGKRDALLADAKQRIKDAPLKYYPKVYGENDAGGTQVMYLNPAGIAFDAMGLPNLGEESAPHLSESVQHGVYQGMLTPAALYAALGFIIWRNKRADANDNGEGNHEH